MFYEKMIEPIDTCGCGDIGYLTVRTLAIDLAQGAGRIHQVPVYHCQDSSCNEYTIPPAVARRLEELAEDMEASGAKELQFNWKQTDTQAAAAVDRNTLRQAFTLQFSGREYEDARVTLVVPGECVFFQSRIDAAEYYLLRYEPETKGKESRYSFSKFYWEESVLEYDQFLAWSEDGYVKELGRITQDEIADFLEDEFGCI